MSVAPAATASVSFASTPSFVARGGAGGGGGVEYRAFELHTAFDLSRDVECMCVSGPRAFVGSADGVVMLYTLRRGSPPPGGAASGGAAVSPPSSPVTGVLSEKHSMSARKVAVKQLVSYSELRMVLALCDNRVTCLSFDQLKPVSTCLDELSPVVAIAKQVSQASSEMPRLCVVRKNVAHIVAAVQGSLQELRTLDLPSKGVQQISWADRTICVAYATRYVVINSSTGAELASIDVTGEHPSMIIPLPSGRYFALVNNVWNSIDVEGHAKPLFSGTARPERVSDFVHAAGYVRPFLVCDSRPDLDIRNVEDEALWQTVRMPAVAADTKGVWAFATFGEDMLAATGQHVYVLARVPLATQVATLLQQMKPNEAVSIYKMCAEASVSERERTAEIARIHEEAGNAYFAHANFNAAFDQWRLSKVDYVRVLAPFPAYLPAAEQAAAAVMRQAQGFGLVDDVVAHKLRASSGFGKLELAARVRDLNNLARTRLIAFLQDCRAARRGRSATVSAQAYQTSERSRRIVDTALACAYIDVNARERLDELFTQDNDVDGEHVGQRLVHAKMYNSLALLQLHEGNVRAALETLRQLGVGDVSDPPHSGLQKTIEVLKSAPDSDDLWEFSRWVLQREPELAMEIFARRAPHSGSIDEVDTGARAPPQLDAERVLGYLSEFGEQSAELTERYLEHLVLDVRTPVAEYHTQLAVRYVEQLLSKGVDSIDPQMPVAQTPGILGVLRVKLHDLLVGSQLYDSDVLLRLLEHTPLMHELVILYGRSRSHADALMSLIDKLEDWSGAEEYCVEQGRRLRDEELRAAGAAPSGPVRWYNPLFIDLLRVALAPKSGAPKTAFALGLLERHALEIDPVAALNVLPDDVAVADIAVFISEVFCDQRRRSEEAIVLNNIARSESARLHTLLVHEWRRFVTTDTMCGVCGRAFQSEAIVVYPNGVAAHLRCTRQNEVVCPVTGINFAQLMALNPV